ncbi:unnamed protein product [Larinioides sclopetarius]|uniref:Translation initiation factor 1 n=1 Tax=Larinioides sclopetarius TaxID=280406 RepID=A0AAV2BEC1_9ARAC
MNHIFNREGQLLFIFLSGSGMI